MSTQSEDFTLSVPACYLSCVDGLPHERTSSPAKALEPKGTGWEIEMGLDV